ncbi:MAG: GNAT family N-acetyltransferase [Clostridia bacterium]|nr:GNAT family N-acetyltransferase [Clostridia bacterium]
MNKIHLEPICYDNFIDALKLKVTKVQRNYVARNIFSLAEAYAFQADGGKVFPFVIYNDKRPIGFVMIGYDIPLDEDDDKEILWFIPKTYLVWRFMIDKRYQGKGYGKQAFQLALDFIRTWPAGKAEYAWLSYEPENEAARKLYASFGFVEEPAAFDPEEEDDEMPAVLKL